MPPVPTSKRSACNRCRIQKLRCCPSADGTDACTRCTRLGARCITSYPRPSNHAQQPLPQRHGQPELRPKGTTPPSTAAAVTTVNSTSAMTATIAPEQTQSPLMGRSATSITSTTNPYDPLSFAIPEDWEYFSSSQTTTLAPNNLMFLDRAQNDMTNDPFYHDSHASPLSSSAFDMGGDNSVETSDVSKEVQQPRSKS